jgi:hypothetical protein
MIGIEEVGYPTQGELLRFLYKAAGVLPEKGDETPGFDEKRRKRLQRTLDRLAGEEGELEENFGEMVEDLAFLVTGYIDLAPLNLAIGEVLFDLLAVYRGVLQEEGTFLSKRDTVRWLIGERLTSAAAVFVARQITKFDLRNLSAFFPDVPDWYLPDLASDDPVWPLAKAMRWVYGEAALTPTQFHYPGRKADEADVVRKRDLENAQNWLTGKHEPSAADLRRTFDRGFAAHQTDTLDDNRCAGRVTLRTEAGARIALFLARCATVIAKELNTQFGREFLRRVCATFQTTLEFALEDTGRLEEYIERSALEQGLSARDPQLRAYAVECWDENLGQRVRRTNEELHAVVQRSKLSSPEIDRLVRLYGRLPVLPAVAWLQGQRDHDIPAGFAEMVMKGEELARDRELTWGRIDAHERALEDAGLAARLPWVIAWLRFLICYRQEDDAQAWHWTSLAYKAARYRAGARQYPIVNHYIEMAAKAGDRVAFRRGVQWARYVGLSVRWLRDEEATPDRLDVVMEMFRRARYGV